MLQRTAAGRRRTEKLSEITGKAKLTRIVVIVNEAKLGRYF